MRRGFEAFTLDTQHRHGRSRNYPHGHRAHQQIAWRTATPRTHDDEIAALLSRCRDDQGSWLTDNLPLDHATWQPREQRSGWRQSFFRFLFVNLRKCFVTEERLCAHRRQRQVNIDEHQLRIGAEEILMVDHVTQRTQGAFGSVDGNENLHG